MALGVGIHLSLTQGISLTRCHRILNPDRSFPRSVAALARRLRSRLARQQAAEEWAAQIDYAIARGIKPTHLDSHKHVHHLPMLHEVVLAASAEPLEFIMCACASAHRWLAAALSRVASGAGLFTRRLSGKR